jgi:hypothetical protein
MMNCFQDKKKKRLFAAKEIVSSCAKPQNFRRTLSTRNKRFVVKTTRHGETRRQEASRRLNTRESMKPCTSYNNSLNLTPVMSKQIVFYNQTKEHTKVSVNGNTRSGFTIL